MKITRLHSPSRNRAFTLVEMLIVITIIALLAALTLGGYTYAMRSSKRRVTTGTFEAIKLALERYNSEFGEFPQPTGSDLLAQFPPGQAMYDTAGAACLYQALTGDGYDQISGATGDTTSGSGGGASASSDGKTEGTSEIKNKMFVEVPQTIFTRKGTVYILIDGFGHPFQYVKAATTTQAAGGGNNNNNNNNTTATSINSTYDLWSYSEDETNTTKKSINTLTDSSISTKWIKNW